MWDRSSWIKWLLYSGIGLSLYLALGDSFKGLLPQSCLSNCEEIHKSSFGSFLGIPVGYFAAVLLLLAIWLHNKNHTRAVGVLLAVFFGAESYLTAIQFVHLRSLCGGCLVFYFIISLCFFLHATRHNFKTHVLNSAGVFLLAHMVAFPPMIAIKPDFVKKVERPQIEIFASPSCDHCEEALESLERFCSSQNADLVLRPVGLSDKDRKLSIEWVCRMIFDRHNYASRRLAEQVVSKNEIRAKALNNGQLAVPIIVVKSGNITQTYKGWTSGIKSKIESALTISSLPTEYSIPFQGYDQPYITTETGACGDQEVPVCAEI